MMIELLALIMQIEREYHEAYNRCVYNADCYMLALTLSNLNWQAGNATAAKLWSDLKNRHLPMN